ncbi:MAG: hypothetical protein ABGX83_05285 [Nitrospira sp.]
MATHKRRSGDTRFAKWFLLKFVLPIILTFVGTGAAGNYFVNQEIQSKWDLYNYAMDSKEAEAAEVEECKDDHQGESK